MGKFRIAGASVLSVAMLATAMWAAAAPQSVESGETSQASAAVVSTTGDSLLAETAKPELMKEWEYTARPFCRGPGGPFPPGGPGGPPFPPPGPPSFLFF
ncbi:hypothetical protein [Rhodopirellula sp. MGV]|uniref:hypothetical protein n=1 Tax=Rhodopirellula sp. MGV TaxID=2023130 RepID=UPI000B96E17A|nr:hypothetical protein [Rhodopirellula sp. MGV]OYP34089.1 hypothetical protein CGZ80_16310 [Rhodopirellula sp. MGV]PNY35602.1 hypothetical protein C2E31_17200 [Rhodopirellula baltica]